MTDAEPAPAGTATPTSAGHAAAQSPAPEATRSGFIGLAGRPNAGKSTLINAVVGAKVAIVSDRPQTTRRAVRGIATSASQDWQMILVDLPGVQKPRDNLTSRMQRRVERELAEADVVLMVVNAEQGVGPGDRFIAKAMLSAGGTHEHGIGVPVICAVNKIDRVERAGAAAALSAAAEMDVVDEVFPVSARTGEGLPELIERLIELLPLGPLLYEAEEQSDVPSDIHLAELIREQVLRRVRAEVPHAVEVRIEEFGRREDGLFDVVAQIWVETGSQKAIVIGRGGKMVGDIGKAARRELERELGDRVFLDLEVRVRERWRRDAGLLDRLGIE